MAQQRFLTPDRLYDRPFTAGHPFRRSPSAGRRWGMLSVFILLCTLIGGYLFVTDSTRVKKMAESELSRLIGGPVTVGEAKLSIFEGLRLEKVNVFIDGSGRADSILFSANTFLVSYDPRGLLAGRLKLTQIIAVDPLVQLTENLDTSKWNYQRMPRPTTGATTRGASGSLPALPEIILRNAQIEYSEVQNGKLSSRGSMTLEGQLAPSSDAQKYSFEFQSRGGASGADGVVTLGPTVTGTLVRDTGQVTARLQDFQFGRDIRSMLPAQVRSWWDRHGLAGGVDVPMLTYTPAKDDAEAKFRVETVLRGVNLTVRPEEWLGRDELAVQAWAGGAFDVMRAVGMNNAGVVDVLAKLVAPSPIQLGQVEGKFTFTESGITIGEYADDGRTVTKSLSGALEQNRFAIDGHIFGYSPLSPANVRIVGQKIQIPASPRYITSMPRQVRELYDHLRPQGLAALHVRVDRPVAGAKLDVSGEIDILDGRFVFDRFPYPVRNATGRIIFGYDPSTGMDQVKLVGLKGYGNADGPNRNSVIHIAGLIAPLTGDAGVQVHVRCDEVRDEPALYAAFPPEVKQALRNLDADGKGLYPKYTGAFECRVTRPIGPKSIWLIDTDVSLRDASGKFAAFPYLMENVSGKLSIREGYVDIVGATMRRGDASLVMDGRVAWRAGVAGTPLEPGEAEGDIIPPRPDLKIIARNVPIDDALLEALPPDRRQWLTKSALKGVLDIDGRVWRPGASQIANVARSASDSDLTHAFEIALRDGSIWPVDGAHVISNLAAKLHLLPDRVTLTDVRAKRGSAELTGTGEIAWPRNKPSIAFSGTAAKLELDPSLYAILPPAAQQAWDAVKPEGIVDLDLSYRSAPGADPSPGVPAAGVTMIAAAAPVASAHDDPALPPPPPMLDAPLAEAAAPDLDLIIHPRQLSATVQAVPYKLTDIAGSVRVSGGRVTLANLSAKHGPASIRLSGGGNVASQTSEWDLRLSADHVPVDDDLRRALPPALATMIEGVKLAGVVSFEFPKLRVRTLPPPGGDAPPPPPPALASAAGGLVPTTAPASASPVDVDFSVKLGFADASLDVGMPMEKVNGGADLAGTVRNSKLASLEGPLDIADLTIASRPVQDLHAEFYKPADQDALRIGNFKGRLAGGSIAGQVDLAFPEVGASRYAMNLVLRNADVRELTGEASADLTGELSASLALEGDWTNAHSRRGRGDVAVNGREMYKIPLVLGLLQITNLSLPITSPFSQASARFMVDGPVVTFESLELRSRDMLMSGSGQLNFDNKRVRMSFTTDNPNWPKVPILGDIVQTAKHELLQIHVKGTLQEPKVSATAVQTLTTTVDEVLRGDGKK